MDLGQAEGYVVFDMAGCKKKQRQDHGVIDLMGQLAKGRSQRGLRKLDIAMDDCEIGTSRPIGRNQGFEFNIGIRISAAVPHNEQSRTHTGEVRKTNANTATRMRSVVR